MYRATFAAPSPAVSALHLRPRTATPPAPSTAANPTACGTLIRPRGSGRFNVRFISPSYLTSRTWFTAFAHEDSAIVPAQSHPQPAQSTRSPLPATYPAAPVLTTSRLSRNLASCL